ncbi:restriction endonuclease subunit S [Hymenobacter terrenus]|uniref:restriction endonuclease subunit S n=1 Tax=Hymenobacter terrenus TaxID=1629124 RepID=UPI000619DB5D|nr:restriction endonuclease subunit S [Hymenobacter terrenus]
MASEVLFSVEGWENTTLGEACKRGGGEIQTGPFGSQLHAADYVAEGIPSIMPQNIGDNRINEQGIARITPADAARLNRYLVREGDIVYSRRGDVERKALVRSHEDGWLCGTGCLRVRFGSEEFVDSLFASFYLSHTAVRSWIVRHAHGATMPNLNTSILGALPFVIPPIAEQRRIAHILGTLDDKIELNRRQNETLESLARALFQSWFVDFDPVRAKASGEAEAAICQRLGLSPQVLALFPAALEDSTLGELPVGWKVGKLEDLCVLQRGFDLPASVRTEGKYSVISAGGIHGTHNEFMVKGPGIVTGRSGVIGNVFFVQDDFWPLNTTLWVKKFMHVGPSYVYQLLSGIDLKSFNAGSAVPSLNRNHVHTHPVIIPSKKLAAIYEGFATTLFKSKKSADDESRNLIALREELLPRLLSGELLNTVIA